MSPTVAGWTSCRNDDGNVIIDWPAIRRALMRWLVGMVVLVVFFIVATRLCWYRSICSEATLLSLNIAGAAAIIGLGIATVFTLVRVNSWLLLTPILPFAAGTVLFSGFGPTSTFLASEATRAFQAWSIFAIRPEQVLVTNLLTTVGIASVIAGMLAALPARSIRRGPAPVIPLRLVALAFVMLGMGVTHLVIMPSIYGVSDFFVPGALRNLRQLPDLGFALAAYLAVRGDRQWQVLFWFLWPVHVLLLIPEFSKRTVIIAMLLPAIGGFIAHRSWIRLVPWIAAIAILFTTLQNTYAVARWQLNEAAVYDSTLNLRERLELLQGLRFDGVDIEDYLPDAKFGVETWWLRLSSSGQQAAAMRLRDAGISGEFTQNPFIYFVPRAIWPEKPTMASPGMKFNQLVTGNPNTTTRVGASIYADGYWQLGWPGVILFGGIAGLVFGVIARLTMNQIMAQQYLYLPAAMLGVNMAATGVNKFLQNGIISGLPIYIAYSLLVLIAYRFWAAWCLPRYTMRRMQATVGYYIQR